MQYRKLLVALTIWAVLVSCVTASKETPVSSETVSQPRSNDTAPGPIDVPSEGREALMRDLRPRDDQPIFLGVSGRLRNREEEVPAAILHAAEQASRYVGIAARYRYVSRRTGRSIGYLDDIDTQWDAALADQLVDSMEIVRQWRDNDGTYVLAKANDVPPAPPTLALDLESGGGEPHWVLHPPTIPGYLAAVGISQRSLRFRDSLDTADQEALKSVLQQAGATVRLVQDALAVERRGTRETVTSAEEASAVLRSFYVLARYGSPDGRYYYSLVVAREDQS